MAPDAPFRLHLVTLGVSDLPRACAFYTAMGLERRAAADTGVAFFVAGNVVLSLYPSDHLAEDATLPPGGATCRRSVGSRSPAMWRTAARWRT